MLSSLLCVCLCGVSICVRHSGHGASLGDQHSAEEQASGDDLARHDEGDQAEGAGGAWPADPRHVGRLIAQQPEQIAYTIIDSKSIDLFMPSVFPPIQANSISEMAVKLDLDPSALQRTVDAFDNSTAVGTFDSTVLDDCKTKGLEPPKSHWARPLDTKPFYAYPLRPGITFTYLGIAVNEKSQVIMQDDTPAPNIFAAGEIMSGNILGKGYMAGLGMTIGTVFGRIAGEEAARYAID